MSSNINIILLINKISWKCIIVFKTFSFSFLNRKSKNYTKMIKMYIYLHLLNLKVNTNITHFKPTPHLKIFNILPGGGFSGIVGCTPSMLSQWATNIDNKLL